MPQRACDRCHGIRARCQFDYGQNACERCLRLNHTCSSERTARKAGRPRKNVSNKDPTPESAKTTQLPCDPTAQLPLDVLENLRDLDPWEVQLAVCFLQNQRFENSFVKDSELSAPMQSAPIRLFLSAPGRVKDALLALAGVMMSEGGTTTPSAEDAVASMGRCCKAIERLREADIRSVDDAKATLFVATTLISVNDITIGHGYLPIARAALLSIRPWYNELVNVKASDFDPHLVPVLFAEVAECVRLREIPTLRFESESIELVDPSYGVAQGVLPYMYDICVLNHETVSGLLDAVEARQRAHEIYETVNSWNPANWITIEHNQEFHLSGTQELNIVRHGACYKLLVQLLLHQLQPEMQRSSLNGAEIATRLRHDIAAAASGQSRPHVQYLLFPYFVACTELQNEAEQAHVLENMENLSGGIATQSCKRMFDFLKYVWTTHSVDPTISWFDLVEDGPQFSIGP